LKVTVVNPEGDSVSIEDTDFWKEMQNNRVGNLLAADRLKMDLTQKQMASKFAVILNIRPVRLQ
jgi:hypothetical protein